MSTVTTDLLEREAALEALEGALDSARAGDGRVVLVFGEAGIGKTSLLRRFTLASRDSTRVLWGACDALFTPRPLGPVVDFAHDAGAELRELVHGDAIPYHVADALIRDLRANGPTVLVLEDVHWADEATLDVLRLLARRVESAPALVVVSYREEAVGPAHPLRLLLGETTAPTVRRVGLSPLSLRAVAELAQTHELDPRELHRVTGGNPFFVTEVLASGGGEIPETVRDAVLARTARLTPGARDVLEAVAVATPHAELWLVEALSGPADGRLDECIAAGMLTSSDGVVSFRHELARLSVEGSLPASTRMGLHRQALAELRARSDGDRDLARLAHHAEAAGDGEAVLLFAPAAGARAASLGAHREAADQYDRALRFAAGLGPEELSELLQLRSRECYLTDQAEEAIDALRRAAACYRELGDPVREGATIASVSNILWCPGRGREARETAFEAVELLERHPAGEELAWAYANLAFLLQRDGDTAAAQEWCDRALELAERLDSPPLVSNALLRSASQTGDVEVMKRALAIAEQAGLEEHVADAYLVLAATSASQGDYGAAERFFEAGLLYCREHGNDLIQLYLLAHRALAELEQGRWTEAAETAQVVLRERIVSTFPRTLALVVLALVRVRRGDPDAVPLLDEAAALADPTDELPRVAPVAAARAEAAWLQGDSESVAEVTERPLGLATRTGSSWIAAELRCWRRRASIEEKDEPVGDGPYARELAGDLDGAVAAWSDLGRPYELAVALSQADDESALRRGLEECERLGAVPLAAIVRRRLRERGASDVPRGPRPSTRENPAQLTAREVEVLGLVSTGLRNSDIAEKLHLSRRTVAHHVSAILRKLDVRTRGEAVAEARRLGLLLEDR